MAYLCMTTDDDNNNGKKYLGLTEEEDSKTYLGRTKDEGGDSEACLCHSLSP